MRRRTSVRIAAALVVAAGAWLVLPVASLQLDEAGVPSAGAARAVPTGVEVVAEERQCGSGGCWDELVLVWPGHDRAELAARLELAGSTPQERCRAVSLLDRRRACVGSDPTLLGRPVGDNQFRVHIRWHRPLDL